MFVVKIVSDLQQVIDVCGKDCQWLAVGHWCLWYRLSVTWVPQTSMTCCKSLTIFTTNINNLLQVTENLYNKHQWPAASHWQSLPQTSMTYCKSLIIFTTNINDLLQVTDNLYDKHQWHAVSRWQSFLQTSMTCCKSLKIVTTNINDLMFVVKIVSDLQQVIDVCGKDCQWLAAGHWCLW
jgi:hypothetical protein